MYTLLTGFPVGSTRWNTTLKHASFVWNETINLCHNSLVIYHLDGLPHTKLLLSTPKSTILALSAYQHHNVIIPRRSGEWYSLVLLHVQFTWISLTVWSWMLVAMQLKDSFPSMETSLMLYIRITRRTFVGWITLSATCITPSIIKSIRGITDWEESLRTSIPL